jgi:hypothetical protein
VQKQVPKIFLEITGMRLISHRQRKSADVFVDPRKHSLSSKYLKILDSFW